MGAPGEVLQMTLKLVIGIESNDLPKADNVIFTASAILLTPEVVARASLTHSLKEI